MIKPSFFTPISYKNTETPSKYSLLQKVDNYFYLGGGIKMMKNKSYGRIASFKHLYTSFN